VTVLRAVLRRLDPWAALVLGGLTAMGVVILLAASAVSASIMLLITAIVRSSTAISVIGGIAGTFFGFLCGIYMPFSNLGAATEKVGSFLPFTHLTIWMKQTLLTDAFKQLSIMGSMKDTMMNDYFSARNIGLAGLNVPFPVMLGFCGVFALICLLAAWALIQKRMANR